MNWRFLIARALYWLSLRLVRLALVIVRPTHPPVVHITGKTYR